MINSVVIEGNSCFDPELRKTGDGTSVTDIRLASTRKVGPADNRRDITTFIDVTVWGGQADYVSKNVNKGERLVVTGLLENDSWEDKTTGEKRSKIKLVASRVVLAS